MNYILWMQKLQSLQHLLNEKHHQSFRNLSKLLYNWIKRAILNVLEHDVQMIISIYTIDVFYNLRVIQFLQQIYFGFDWALSVLFDVIKAHLLYSNWLPIYNIQTFEHLAASSVAKDVSNLIGAYCLGLLSSLVTRVLHYLKNILNFNNKFND